ncbi:MAG: hypothetical protein WCK31_02140 [bacterium]
MDFNYLTKRESASIIVYSQDKNLSSKLTLDIIKIIFEHKSEDEVVNNPDIVELSMKDQDKLSIGIEEIKNILPKFFLKPLKYTSKVLVISDSEKLTFDAQAGLLKTIEEPAKGSFIILKTTNINSLLSTIKSRCEIINLNGTRTNTKSFGNILNAKLEERLNITKEILAIKDPKERRENVDKLFNQIFLEIKENTTNISNANIYIVMESVFKYQEYFKSEVNLRLTLENLMISLFKILKY